MVACDFVLKYISLGQYWASFLLPTSHECYTIVQQLPDALAKERTRRNIWSSRYQSPFTCHCSLSLLPFALMLPQEFCIFHCCAVYLFRLHFLTLRNAL